MSFVAQNIKEYLKSNGFSATQSRLTLFDALKDREALSVSQIIDLMKNKADRASVYRNLVLFEKLGVIHRLNIGWKYKLELSDAFKEHHHHLSCERCGMTFAIDENPHIEKDIAQLAEKHGFVATAHQLEIRGLCWQYQKNLEPQVITQGSYGSLTLPPSE